MVETFSAKILLSTALILTILHLKRKFEIWEQFYFGHSVRSKRIETRVQYSTAQK